MSFVRLKINLKFHFKSDIESTFVKLDTSLERPKMRTKQKFRSERLRKHSKFSLNFIEFVQDCMVSQECTTGRLTVRGTRKKGIHFDFGAST